MSLKTIQAAVGENGMNIPTDVATVQYLLNCVPASQGGPQQELKIDGFAGVLTLEAIKHFQNFRFGSANSRVEANEQTFAELKKYDPLPLSAAIVVPNLGETDKGVKHVMWAYDDESPKRTSANIYSDESPKERSANLVGGIYNKSR
jgi:hypothetical protein